MGQKSSPHTTSSRSKWPWIALAGILVLSMLFRLSLMSIPLHEWAKEFVITTANEHLQPQLSIGKLSGDLWEEITLVNVAFHKEGTVVASIDTVRLKYDALSYFGDIFKINKMKVIHPYLNITQENDGSWNFRDWFEPSDDTASSSFAFSIVDFLLKQGSATINSSFAKSDSTFNIENLRIGGNFSATGDTFKIGLEALRFDLENTLIPGTIAVQSAATMKDRRVSLEKLVIASGQSWLSASGITEMKDSTAQFQMKVSPLAWKDIAALADENAIRQNLNISMQLKGNARQFDMQLSAQAGGIEQLQWTGRFQWQDQLALTRFNFTAQKLDLATFLGDTTMPQVQDIVIDGQGKMPVSQHRQARWTGKLSAGQMEIGNYHLDAISGHYSLNEGDMQLKLTPQRGHQQLMVKANITEAWSQEPQMNARVKGTHLKPRLWLQQADYAGSISFSGEVSGAGWYPQESLWGYQLEVEHSHFMGQPIEALHASGRFNASTLTSQTVLKMGRGTLRLQAEGRHLQTMPQFTFQIQADRLDLSAIDGLEEYSSAINGKINGEGQGNSLQNLHLQAHMHIDTSAFKGERINQLTTEVQLSGSVLSLQNIQLQSTIAGGRGQGTIDLSDIYAIDNRLSFVVQLKDLSFLASLTGTKQFEAAGRLEGHLRLNGQQGLVFQGGAQMEELNYNQQFLADSLSAQVKAVLKDQAKYEMQIKVINPVVSSLKLQNINVQTKGTLADSTALGEYRLQLLGEKEKNVLQAGQYKVAPDTISLQINRFLMHSSLHSLSLSHPFQLIITGKKLQTDTLHLATPNQDAFIKFAVPYADSIHQKGYLKGMNLNLATIQESIFDKAYVEGTISGGLHFNRTDSVLTATGDLLAQHVKYRGATLDSLHLTAQIEDDQLEGSFTAHRSGQTIANGTANIPFKTAYPDSLEKSFFGQSVLAHISVNQLQLGQFNNVLKWVGITDTKGLLSLNGKLQGTVGHPHLQAILQLTEAQLSGVPVDSLNILANYSHSRSRLSVEAGLTSLQQKALTLEAQIPFQIDMKNLATGKPGRDERIMAKMAVDRFNLHALDDFMAQDQYRNITGLVDGRLYIFGSPDNLQASGHLALSHGAVDIVQKGIRLHDIQSNIQVESGKIILENLSAQSGEGWIEAQGKMGLDELMPDSLHFAVRAENFNVANTSKYSARINLDVRAKGTVNKPRITGNLKVLSGFVELSNFGKESVENVSLDTTLAPNYEISLYDSLALDMNIEFNKRFFVRNQRYLEMQMALDGQLNLFKEAGGKPRLFGTLNTVGGYAQPLGKEFTLVEGTLAYEGDPVNPQMNIRTMYEPPQTDHNVKIWYTIAGTIEEPQFKFASSPQMELQNIISYTLFGQPYYKLNSIEQAVAGSGNEMIADLAMEILMDRIESLATRKLGVDVVKIGNTRVGGESGTSVTTGWYINPRIFFAVQNVITGAIPSTGFYLEYYLRENFKLIISQGNDRGQGVDLQWEYDY